MKIREKQRPNDVDVHSVGRWMAEAKDDDVVRRAECSWKILSQTCSAYASAWLCVCVAATSVCVVCLNEYVNGKVTLRLHIYIHVNMVRRSLIDRVRESEALMRSHFHCIQIRCALHGGQDTQERSDRIFITGFSRNDEGFKLIDRIFYQIFNQIAFEIHSFVAGGRRGPHFRSQRKSIDATWPFLHAVDHHRSRNAAKRMFGVCGCSAVCSAITGVIETTQSAHSHFL